MQKFSKGNSRRILEDDDLKYLWHPFTQMEDWERERPLVIERGEGCYLTDIHGKQYLDGVSSLWVNIHGHRHRQIDRAIKSQVDRISHSTMLGLSNVPAINLARRLVEISPGELKRVFFSDNGSTACEVALKMAFQYWQQSGKGDLNKKVKFLCLDGAYHGDTIGSASVGGIDLFHEIYRPLLFDAFKAPAPHCYRCPFGHDIPAREVSNVDFPDDCGRECLLDVEKILKENHSKIAGFIVEPIIQGAAGMITQPRGWLKRLWEITKEHDVFLICDEVATGFGRTGRMFACEHEGVSPDIMAIAKGLSGGYLPIAATLTSERIYEGFKAPYQDKKTLFHGHTYTGNPLAAQASLANLDAFEGEDTLKKLEHKIPYLTMKLKKLEGLDHVGEVRQRGFMVGVELVRDKETKEPYDYGERIGHRVIMEARRRGVILRPLEDVIVIMPPLAIKEDELDTLIDVTYESIQAATEG